MIDPKLQMFKPMVTNAILQMDNENQQKLIDTLKEVYDELSNAK